MACRFMERIRKGALRWYVIDLFINPYYENSLKETFLTLEDSVIWLLLLSISCSFFTRVILYYPISDFLLGENKFITENLFLHKKLSLKKMHLFSENYFILPFVIY